MIRVMLDLPELSSARPQLFHGLDGSASAAVKQASRQLDDVAQRSRKSPRRALCREDLDENPERQRAANEHHCRS
jgi:hypothetical protein